ncbi:unnamed protein product [Clavelina lepadiformis]|uniref:Uncharacterized protein n=1 Tax=Clavelina lepadiformis TaxID=159417 RepID=A0ABP0GGE1_CLALP
MTSIGPSAPPPPSYDETFATGTGFYNTTYFSGDPVQTTQPGQYSNFYSTNPARPVTVITQQRSNNMATRQSTSAVKACVTTLIVAVFFIIIITIIFVTV